jgi:hypothetical protein
MLLATCFHAGILPGLSFNTEDGGDFRAIRRLTSNGLHGVISRMIVLFILTAVSFRNVEKSDEIVLLLNVHIHIRLHSPTRMSTYVKYNDSLKR